MIPERGAMAVLRDRRDGVRPLRLLSVTGRGHSAASVGNDSGDGLSSILRAMYTSWRQARLPQTTEEILLQSVFSRWVHYCSIWQIWISR